MQPGGNLQSSFFRFFRAEISGGARDLACSRVWGGRFARNKRAHARRDRRGTAAYLAELLLRGRLRAVARELLERLEGLVALDELQELLQDRELHHLVAGSVAGVSHRERRARIPEPGESRRVPPNAARGEVRRTREEAAEKHASNRTRKRARQAMMDGSQDTLVLESQTVDGRVHLFVWDFP